MLITAKGQITIPKEFRDALGMLPHTHVAFERVGDELRVKKASATQASHAFRERLIRQMSGKGTSRMTTDEIMRLTRGEDECPF